MTTELRIVLVIASFVTAALMLRRIRRSKVRIEDSVFWIGLSTVILVVSIFPQIADACAAALHIYETTNFLFLFFIFVLLVKLFTMSVHVSQLESKLDRAVQEQALGAKELEEKTERPQQAAHRARTVLREARGPAQPPDLLPLPEQTARHASPAVAVPCPIACSPHCMLPM